MNSKRILLTIVALLMVIFTVAQASAYVHQTIQTYNGYCSEIPGFARVLQRLNFISSAKCILDNPTTCHDNAACTIDNPPTGQTNKGHCFQMKGSNGKNIGCKYQ